MIIKHSEKSAYVDYLERKIYSQNLHICWLYRQWQYSKTDRLNRGLLIIIGILIVVLLAQR